MTTLMPRNGGLYLKPEEVIGRMQKTFAYVETTEEGAREYIAAWLEQLAFVTPDGRNDADLCMDQLEQFQYDARFIHFGNDLGADGICLSMLMIPHQPLIIEGRGTDRKTLALIEHAAAALGYEVFDPERADVSARAVAKRTGTYATAA
jgi:hypothetical protein